MRDVTPLRERLYSRLQLDPQTGCLIWTGPLAWGGYGHIAVDGHGRSVHRVVWELENGPVPAGLQLDHLCRVRTCANVTHLEPVTQRENLLRGETIVAACYAKTHCDKGHEFDLLNTYWRPNGARDCRACKCEAARAFRKRNPGRNARAGQSPR